MDKNPDYFEGTLQLRNPTQDIVNFVADAIAKRDDVWISKTIKQKNGVDLKISSNKFLKEIGKKLKKSFTGELIESSSLFTRHRLTQKEVFRGTVMFRYYDVKKGDIVNVRGDDLEIISFGKDILCKEVKTKKKVHINFNDLRR